MEVQIVRHKQTGEIAIASTLDVLRKIAKFADVELRNPAQGRWSLLGVRSIIPGPHIEAGWEEITLEQFRADEAVRAAKMAKAVADFRWGATQ